MRLLTISYGFLLQRAYQWKAVELSARCDRLLAIVPERWKELWSDRTLTCEPGPLDRVDHLQVPLRLKIDKHFALLPSGRLRTVLRDFQPDVVEFDNEPFNLGSAQLVYAVGRHAPEARVFLHAAQNLLKRYPPPFHWTERYVFRRCAGVFARSEAAERVLVTRGLPARKIHRMGHGVSLREFAPAARRQLDATAGTTGPTAGTTRPVLYVGALTRQKGVDVLLRACALSRRFQRLVVAGDGPERPELEASARDLGLARRCEFRGSVGHDELLELYGSAACLVLPARTTPTLVEQFGRVLIEAMAAGCPVIASDSGNVPTVVGDAGLVVPEEDAGALAAAMDRVLDDSALRRDLQGRGLERVRREYEWSVVADRMMEIFRGRAEPIPSPRPRAAPPRSAPSVPPGEAAGRR